jgi:hypothetical protein
VAGGRGAARLPLELGVCVVRPRGRTPSWSVCGGTPLPALARRLGEPPPHIPHACPPNTHTHPPPHTHSLSLPRLQKGVLTYKRESEKFLEASGLPYTLLRPSRLTDGPYTSYDLNTLLQATAGSRKDVVMAPRDTLRGEASRITVAEAAVQALGSAAAEGRAFAIESVEGAGPGDDAAAWERLFEKAYERQTAAAV